MTQWASCLLFASVLPDPHHHGTSESEEPAVRRLAPGPQVLIGNKQPGVGASTRVMPLAPRKGEPGAHAGAQRRGPLCSATASQTLKDMFLDQLCN